MLRGRQALEQRSTVSSSQIAGKIELEIGKNKPWADYDTGPVENEFRSEGLLGNQRQKSLPLPYRAAKSWPGKAAGCFSQSFAFQLSPVYTEGREVTV
jgi:hypothetical protein